MSLGPYAPFIVTSYALVAAVVLLLIILGFLVFFIRRAVRDKNADPSA